MAVTRGSGQVATAAVNEVTGKRMVTGTPSEAFKEGWDRIFGKKEQVQEERDEGTVIPPDQVADA